MMSKLTDKEVLQKAIEIAAKDSPFCSVFLKRMNSGSEWSEGTVVKMVCFTHMFAKAFWPEDHVDIEDGLLAKGACPWTGTCESCGAYWEEYGRQVFSETCWKEHLANMVILENPIDYLRKFIDNEKT